MTRHLPECNYEQTKDVCYCDMLRACEQRMLEDDVLAAAYHGEKGYQQGIRDAYDAVDKGGRAAAQIEALAHLRSVTL